VFVDFWIVQVANRSLKPICHELGVRDKVLLSFRLGL
jgi:hypothetical protein